MVTPKIATKPLMRKLFHSFSPNFTSFQNVISARRSKLCGSATGPLAP